MDLLQGVRSELEWQGWSCWLVVGLFLVLALGEKSIQQRPLSRGCPCFERLVGFEGKKSFGARQIQVPLPTCENPSEMLILS